MAEQLQSFKNILTKKYIKTGTTPVFTGELEKLRGHWDMQGAKIKDDDFLSGEAIIWINWEEIYQLFHQEDLDISMVGLWVL